MSYIVTVIAAFIIGVVVCRNVYHKDSIFSDLDIMLITQYIEGYENDRMYESLKFEWEYFLRTHDQNIDKLSTELQKIVDHVLGLD
jgi:hypothetical protein